ncbi:hypothetical protein C4578_01315 [Candidatus Microgenomates bacterium]|jgi:hypothetical protein|nr:MAG: hypothetical protein C4578_01315 [Candidatus Microgenomates bacterium]
MKNKGAATIYLLAGFIILLFLGGYLVFTQKPESLKELTEESQTAVNKEEDSLLKKERFFLEIESPKNKTTLGQAIVEVRGKTLAQAEVFVNDKETVADKDGSFNVSLELEEGENYILVVAGNEIGDAEEELVVYYEIE